MADAETLQQLKADMKSAMKARQKQRLQTIRMALSSLKNARIDKGEDLDDEEIVDVLSTEAKKRREAADAYADAGRDELAAKESDELATIQQYLPAQMTDQQARALVDKAVADTGATSPGDIGKVMGYVMPKIKGRYEGAKIKDIVLDTLQP